MLRPCCGFAALRKMAAGFRQNHSDKSKKSIWRKSLSGACRDLVLGMQGASQCLLCICQRLLLKDNLRIAIRHLLQELLNIAMAERQAEFAGLAVYLIEPAKRRGHFQQTMLQIRPPCLECHKGLFGILAAD